MISKNKSLSFYNYKDIAVGSLTFGLHVIFVHPFFSAVVVVGFFFFLQAVSEGGLVNVSVFTI